MSKPSSSRRLSFVRTTSISLLIGLVLALATGASAGSGFAFVDSISSFLGITAVPEPQPAVGAGATYTWNQTGTASWATDTNWTPTRTTPAASDIMVFSGGGTVTVTNVPTQTIAQLSVSGSSTVNLQANAASTVLTIAGDTGTDLDVASGSALNDTGTNTMTITLSTGATGSFSGNMTCSAAAHKLDAADASAITFNSGATFTQDTGCTGNAFTNAGTASAIVFASGSTFISKAGSNPFGLTQPASKVVFQTGSSYSHQHTGAPSFSGRTYANFEINASGFSTSATGGNASVMDNLTMTVGTLNFNLTGTPGHAIKGNISVASGATLTFAPASASTINLNGTSAQTISGAGTLTAASTNSTFVVNNANGISLSRNVSISGTLNLTSGNITTGANTLTIASGGTVSRTSGHVVGNLQKTTPISGGAGSLTFEVGDASLYAPVNFATTTGLFTTTITTSTTAGDHPSIGTSGLDPSKTANRYWTLVNNTPGSFSTANLTFNFNNPADLDGGANPLNFVVRKFDSPSTWTSTTTGTVTTTSTQATGVSGFSDFQLGEVPAATATNTNTPTDTPTDTPTYTPTDTPTNTATNTATNTPTATPTDSSDIRIIKDDSADPVEELVPFKYEIEIENLGPDTAHDVALQDTIPIEIVFLDLRSTLPIPVGEDMFITPPGGFSGWGTTPIPPGFFGPGSDPFGGTMQLLGVPTGPMGNEPSGLCPAIPGGLMAGPMGQQPFAGSPPTCGGPGLQFTDTIIRRFNPSGLDIGGGSAMIPIEIVALHLQSVNPITVTYNGGMNPEPWVVDVGLAPVVQPPGNMNLNRNGNTNGGTISITLPVIRRYTFFDVGPGGYPTVFIDRLETFTGTGSFTQETGSCTTPTVGTTGTISCSGYTLDSFFDVFFEIDVSSTSNAGGSTWSNTATTTATEFDPIPTNNTSTETTTITEPATPTATNTSTPADTPTDTPTSTPTDTPTATATDTPTNTPTPPIEITGTVNYGNPVTGPNPRGVPNVLISGAGSPAVSDTTGAPGTYLLTGFGAGSYTVTPSKSGGINGSITGFDAARVAQYLTGNYSFSSAQQTVADVSGAGGISSYDAALIARYALALGPPTGNSGTWLFSPTNRFYASVTGSLSGEDYAALVMGETSGNWGDPTPYRPAFGPEKLPAVAAPRLSTPADNEVIVPVRIDGAADKGIISYEFDLSYDPSVIQPQADPVDVAGTVSSGLFAVANAEGRGLLRVVVYGAMPLESNGVMLNLRFTAVGAPGSVSPLTWERLVLNEGTPRVTATDGQVELVKAAANQAELTGRLLTAFGAGLPNARVTLTDSTGHSRTVLSNGFGAYRFGDLKVGQTYTISVEARNYAFTPITVSVTGQSVTADIIATQ